MEKVFSQEVIDFTKQCMEEINAELDVTYCDENNIEFPNGEVDMTSIDLYSREATEKAYKFLHPKNK